MVKSNNTIRIDDETTIWARISGLKPLLNTYFMKYVLAWELNHIFRFRDHIHTYST